jgi:hypothetical protein
MENLSEIFYENYQRLIAVFILISMSISARILLQVLGQRWITTTAHTATLVLLPIITYIITTVISGNIALSLGMVGALSIVRFRNPVRSPLELSVYFGAITMGITASVSLLGLIFFGCSILLAVIILLLAHYLSLKLYKKPFFTMSFSEGNSLSTLSVNTLKPETLLDVSEYLTMKRATKDHVEYILTSNKFEDLLNLQENLKNKENIVKIQFNK